MPAHLAARARFLWLNLWFWTIAPIYTIIFFLSALIFITLFHQIRRKPKTTSWLVRRSLNFYGLGILKCGWPLVKTKFIDHAPEDKPPFVLVSNHPSSSDGFLMSYMWFEAVQVLNIWPNKVPIMSFIAKHAGYLSVREMSFEQFLSIGSQLLKDGCSVIAFPEGTRSGQNQMGNFHGSAFRLAQHNNVKIIPLVLTGNKQIPPRGSAFLNPGHILVSKLPAITPEDYKELTPFALKNKVREIMRQHLEEITAAGFASDFGSLSRVAAPSSISIQSH